MAQRDIRIHIMPRRRFIVAFAAVISLLLVQHCTTSETSGQRSPLRFRFIFCCDVHYGGPKDNAMFSKVIREWNTRIQLWDFVVLAGDLTPNGDLDKLDSVKKYLDKLQKPYFPIIGNHDITEGGEKGKINYFKVFGDNRGNYLHIHKNVGLLSLNYQTT